MHLKIMKQVEMRSGDSYQIQCTQHGQCEHIKEECH